MECSFISKLEAPLFYEIKDNTCNDIPVSTQDQSTCTYHFAAPDKSNSFNAYDETGLLGAVCRYRIPLRYLNLRQGEVSCGSIGSPRYLAELPDQWRATITYGIGCQFSSYFQQNHQDVSQRVQFMVNAFHVYAHELKYQVLIDRGTLMVLGKLIARERKGTGLN